MRCPVTCCKTWLWGKNWFRLTLPCFGIALATIDLGFGLMIFYFWDDNKEFRLHLNVSLLQRYIASTTITMNSTTDSSPPSTSSSTLLSFKSPPKCSPWCLHYLDLLSFFYPYLPKAWRTEMVGPWFLMDWALLSFCMIFQILQKLCYTAFPPTANVLSWADLHKI